jgi:Domain of unknown function (DUF4258)
MPVTLAMRWQFRLFIVFGLFVSCHSSDSGGKSNKVGIAPFDRHGQIILTKHARCRMDCRHITMREIHEILDNGTINYDKSEPNSHPDPKFAVEGYTEEKQHLRIIVAPENEKLIIVTCIELGVEWQCDCN